MSIILAVDTTTDWIDLSVSDGKRIWDFRRRAARDHDERLWTCLGVLLKRARIGISQIDVLAAASGPGSFTGIRVGMTFTGVLARSLGKPVVAVSRLEAEAQRACPRAEAGRIAVVTRGHKEEFFFQIFSNDPGGVSPVSEASWTDIGAWPKEFAARNPGPGILLAGPSSLEAFSLLPASMRAHAWQGPALRARFLIPVALRRVSQGLASGDASMGGGFSPLYIKPAYYERGPSRA